MSATLVIGSRTRSGSGCGAQDHCRKPDMTRRRRHERGCRSGLSSLQGPAPRYSCEGCDQRTDAICPARISAQHRQPEGDDASTWATLFAGVTSLRGADLSGQPKSAGHRIFPAATSRARLRRRGAEMDRRDPQDIAKTAVICINATGAVFAARAPSGSALTSTVPNVSRSAATTSPASMSHAVRPDRFPTSPTGVRARRGIRSAVLCGADFGRATLDHVILRPRQAARRPT